MMNFEQEATLWGAHLGDLFIAKRILCAHQDREWVQAAHQEQRLRYREDGVTQRIKNVGQRQVTVLLPGGTKLTLPTPYVRPSLKGKRGRPRGSGKRREGGSGAYPVLEKLGVRGRVTPLTRSKISRQTVLTSSYAEAQEQLARTGMEVDVFTVKRVAVETGREALELRDEALARARVAPLPTSSPVANRRLRISVDGGRVRTRKTHRGRRKGKNGRRPFTLRWQEPRVITVDILNDKGEADPSQRPIYEVTMASAEEVFELVTGLLRQLGAHLAQVVEFVSDGADWIWTRVDALMKAAEIPKDRVRLVLDYYHVSEHIGTALEACRDLSAEKRRARHEELNRLLLTPGGPQKVIEQLSSLARGRRAKAIRREIAYLKKHITHMRYAELRAEKLPIGSGVVESAIRRVINQRFKAASMSWLKENVEPLMYLRALLKAGRWDDLMSGVLDRRHWLSPPVAAEPLQEAA